jgi:hypothetical protein
MKATWKRNLSAPQIGVVNLEDDNTISMTLENRCILLTHGSTRFTSFLNRLAFEKFVSISRISSKKPATDAFWSFSLNALHSTDVFW